MYAEHSGDTPRLEEDIMRTEMECNYKMEDMNANLQTQIAALSAVVSEHDQQIFDNRDRIEALIAFTEQQAALTDENRMVIGMLESTIQALSAEITGLRTMVDDLRTRVAELESR